MKLDAPVIIAGGGPVGMTLALELASHGVASILLERNHGTTRHPKMDLTNGRSMELYRRLGLADKLRSVGVPATHPLDIMWATSPSGSLLHTFKYPSPRELRTATERLNDGTGTAEPGMRISQIILEPVLREAIDANPLIDARFGWKFDRLRQNQDSVTATIQNTDTNVTQELSCSFLAGCDGGGSRVRRTLGIGLEGHQNIARILMIHFKSSDRQTLNPWGIAWHLQSLMGTLVAQDDRNTWTVHLPLAPGIDEKKIDAGALLRQFTGKDFDFQIEVANPWSPNQVVAERYIDGRVILAGDAAHQVIPTGGYGMNTGVGDAVDLGWKLSAVINGWGGPALLESYECERRQIAVQNRAASQDHFAVRIKIAEEFAAAMAQGSLDEPGSAGQARRSALGATIEALGNAENECWGLEHGFRYDVSPLLPEADGIPPIFDRLRCSPTTFPGARLPHIMLHDGTALIDHLGREFTLLAIGNVDTANFAGAAAARGIPLSIVRLKNEAVLSLLERRLILVRPDQHIAWRGDDAPSEVASVLARVSGNAAA